MSSPMTFGVLLRQLRKRAGMTQGDLAAALGYSASFIGGLEQARRLPAVQTVLEQLVPALGLQEEPHFAARLVELAARARGERPPVAILHKRETQIVVTDELTAPAMHVPAPPTDLIGREQEVRSLCHRLPGHSGRLLTLVGPPGVGKTTLALAVAARMQNGYKDGACFVALATVSDAVLMTATIASAVGSSDASPKPPNTKLIEFLRRKTMLLVLDNLEQIGDAGSLIAALLAECPGLCVLATSRERLHLRAEQRFKVPPLDLSSAVALFTQRAAAVNADFVLTAANQATIEAICERLDRLPLALELCAAQIDLLSPAQILAHLQMQRLDLLVEGAHDLPPRQRTLRTAIGHSYALLSEEERMLFRSLGVFSGGFALPELERMHAEGQESQVRAKPSGLLVTLHQLIGKSLVHAETLPNGEQRFLLLETLREFALEQLRAQGEEAEMRRRHYFAYLQLFRIGDSYLRGKEMVTWLARLEAEQENLRAALQWTVDEARYVDTAWLLVAASEFWTHNGHRYETTSWMLRLLPHRQVLTVELRLAILCEFVISGRDVEEFPSPDFFRSEIMELLELSPYKQLHMVAWLILAVSATDVAETAACLAKSLLLAQAPAQAPVLRAEFCNFAEDDFQRAVIQWVNGIFLFEHGDAEQATALVTESLHYFRKQGNQPFIADCVGALGRQALRGGDAIAAHTYFQEIVTIGKSNNLPLVLAEWQPFLGLVTLYLGNAIEARHLLEESLRLCLEIRNTFNLARVSLCLAEMGLWEGEVEQAAHWLGQSLAYHPAPSYITSDELHRLFVAARLATLQQQYRRAAILLGAAESAQQQLHYIYGGLQLQLRAAAQASVEEALGAELFGEAFATGQKLPLDEVYA